MAGEPHQSELDLNGVEHEQGLLEEEVEGEVPLSGEEAQGGERVVVKFLVPNVAAGSIIGKGGQNITEIQTQSSARMQLSKANEFYPGTTDSQDRILLISGTVNQLLTALHLVLSKLKSEPGALRAVQAKDGESVQLRMLVHSRLCGTLIGKGGATIRSFNEDSSAVFNISPPPTLPGLTERVVRITGDTDQLMRAVALVVTKLSENPDYHLLTDANLSYGSRYGSSNGNGSMGNGSSQGLPPHHHTLGVGLAAPARLAHTASMPIPEERVGVVIGKQGAVVNQIKELLGVGIRISKKGEYMPGTQDRACHITGPVEAVEIAKRLILQKIEARV